MLLANGSDFGVLCDAKKPLTISVNDHSVKHIPCQERITLLEDQAQNEKVLSF